MSPLDVIVFLGFVAAVVFIGLFMSRDEAVASDKGASDYFLAGRGLTWWLIGFSLIAANISTEQFVGMSGQAADWLGMAIASYEWMAAVTLVCVAFLFLPKFLRCGIYTVPEFLEYRFGSFSRTVMAVATMVILVGVPTASVIYSGAKVITVAFQGQALLGLDLGNMTVACWIIGGSAAIYVFVGGLKACAWADLLQGAALIVGGGILAWLAVKALGAADPTQLAAHAVNPGATADKIAETSGLSRFWLLNDAPAAAGGKLHMVRPSTDPSIPWTALVVGLWIPNFFYWGLNQYIMQRTLGAKSLAEGQKGIVFAAGLKLIVPFIVVIPGILAFNLFNTDLRDEAARKNEPAIAAMRADSAIVYPMDVRFAATHADLAAEVYRHNAALLHQPAEEPVDAAALQAANDALVTAAKGSALVVGTRLVAYDYDAAFPTLLRRLLAPGTGLKGFVFAAIFGAVVSSLAAMLNSASTIFAMDLYRKVRKEAPARELVRVGRGGVLVFTIIACLIAPGLGNPAFGGIFTFIQEFQGFISPGVLAVFIFGLMVARTPRFAGWLGIILNAILYGALKVAIPDVSFLNRMAICFGLVVAVLTIVTMVRPLAQPVELPTQNVIAVESSGRAKAWGLVVIVATVALYAMFW
ncbi:sodium/solute symporter [Horticoccus luteus]|uniref:Sodium/solute symporter n=1 Tax=Horticoccus luteus TaxID=2862869 RepID=A0A8F9TST1_9BACT|nr:sodium/solute symporter [Horticoccus luteus]QYM78569.1 sodium/solute symporter [Horticoccus luteus]